MTKRILFIINNLGYGGAQKIQVFLANMASNDFENVDIVVLFGTQCVFNIDDKVNVKYLSNKQKKRNIILKIFLYFKIVFQLRKVIKRRKPKVIISFSSEEVLLAHLASLFRKVKILGSERYNPLGLTKKGKKKNRFYFSFADHMVLQVPTLIDFYNRKDITVIPNPYFSEVEIEPCKEERNNKIVAVSARFEYRKGIDVLLNAFSLFQKKYPNYELEIYGDGELKSSYLDMIETKKIKNVTIYPSKRNIIQFLKCSKMFILPSREEGMPNILIEALGAGIPSISADCPPGGPRFLSKTETRLLLYDVEDYNKLSEKMIELAINQELSKTLSSNALSIREELNPQKIYNKWRKVIIQLVGDLGE
ncbi:MAG: glycosyltransferase family 4 protein [Acholeplasmataceae bacterium]|jgi:glycosyltransferase involved in cell wall biosynthesis|nr:glycosyltransferase family 4 protein [Acholeplasmataceae bacterium]